MSAFDCSVPANIGKEMHAFLADSFPIPRSITGAGVRETLRRIQQRIPLAIFEVPSGAKVFDWEVPKEWNIRDAYVANSAGQRVIDFQQSNLRVVGYSVPVRETLPLAELKKHLFTLPRRPDWIPYVTSYYQERWGFCLTQRELEALPEGVYEAVIDSSLEPGSLTWGEFFLAGASEKEVLISTYVCHPALANDNAAGFTLATFLAERLKNSNVSLRYSYRFLFLPETIGAIAWLARNPDAPSRIAHGLVVTCVGDPGMSTYKRSRRGDAEIDRAVEQVLKDSGTPHRVLDFFPSGSDERQYCSPGFDLPVGSLMRTPYGRFPEYHTSADNLDFVTSEALRDSFEKYLATVCVLEHNAVYRNMSPYGEPNLGRRGLYNLSGVPEGRSRQELALLWTLNLSDGSRSLLDIARRSGMTFADIYTAAEALRDTGLLRPVDEGRKIL